jgi:hypothetical protein
MKTQRVKVLLLAGLLAIAAAAIGSSPATAATLAVCPSGCAFSQIGPALAAAKNGDTISVAAGTYNGGFTIDKSINLAGAGSARTTISGGGPVVTIGNHDTSSEPTVAIDAVTITGGVTRSSWQIGAGVGVIARGGGIEIPPNADFSGGATVTISRSVVTGNRVAPTATAPFGPTCPNGEPCPFAAASGGGIDNWGSLTLSSTTVSNNLIGSASGLGAVSSDADGAGISNWLGPLTITNSAISGNQAAVTAPNGRSADAGGIFLVGRTLTMSNSSVLDNSATVEAGLPSSVEDLGVAAGGMHLTGDVQAVTISNSSISGNVATATNTLGDIGASSAGLHIDIADSNSVTLSNDLIGGNTAHAAALPGSTGNADASSGAGEITGTLTNVRLTGNSVDASSAAGNATAEGGATVFDGGTFTNSLIGDNHLSVSSPHGSAVARGAGIWVAVSLTLRNSTVSGNTADSSGASGSVRGGGIFDIPFPDGPDGAPGGPLVLQNSNLTGNVLTGSAGFPLQGGGLYVQNEPLTSTNSVIANNTPDQCFGC